VRTIIAHGHIFKNAGTTFDWSLERNFGDQFMDHRQDQLMKEKGAAHVAELVASAPGLQAFSSHHLCSSLPEVAGLRLMPVYFLRHPIERVASVYNFERQQQADTPGARAAKEKSFAEYVRWRMQGDVAHTIRNYQMHYLAGSHTHASITAPGIAAFSRAMTTLRATPLIGIVERYDESMLLLEHQLQEFWPALDLSYVRQNVSRRGLRRGVKSSVEAVLKRLGPLQKTLIDNNSLDLALYQLVNRRLDEQLAKIDDLDARLVAFRQRCEALNRA
jgi:hypothetical protein